MALCRSNALFMSFCNHIGWSRGWGSDLSHSFQIWNVYINDCLLWAWLKHLNCGENYEHEEVTVSIHGILFKGDQKYSRFFGCYQLSTYRTGTYSIYYWWVGWWLWRFHYYCYLLWGGGLLLLMIYVWSWFRMSLGVLQLSESSSVTSTLCYLHNFHHIPFSFH